jgi:molybdate/tungstate transport system substrate-binding protein
LTILFISCRSSGHSGKEEKDAELIIFHAGSLSLPFKQIAETFQAEYPNVVIKTEAAGSVECARKIIDLKKDCDVMASADYRVINDLLIPDYSSWNIKFAGNEMVIAFTEKSKYYQDIHQDNWFQILANKDIIYGRSDPDKDPCGYRALLSMKLAELFYDQPDLVNLLSTKNTNYIRPKEVDLIAMLETNTIDYAFNYRSVAEQHRLKYLRLPEKINLSNPDLNNYYSKVNVDISGKKPGEKINITGESMVYGVTILNNAPNKDIAIKFIAFLLDSEKGMALMEKNGQHSLVPQSTLTYDKIPENLKKYALEPFK